MRTVFVEAKKISNELVHKADAGVAGRYAIEVDDDVPSEDLAGVAMDVFHDNVPVDCLDDFEFSVTDEWGQELTEPDDYDSYSGTGKGRLL